MWMVHTYCAFVQGTLHSLWIPFREQLGAKCLAQGHNCPQFFKYLCWLLSCLSDVKLVGGASQCTGRLEMKHQEQWRPVCSTSKWSQSSSAVVCRQLGCGSIVSTGWKRRGWGSSHVWQILSNCDGSESLLRECGAIGSFADNSGLELICSGNKMTSIMIL